MDGLPPESYCDSHDRRAEQEARFEEATVGLQGLRPAGGIRTRRGFDEPAPLPARSRPVPAPATAPPAPTPPRPSWASRRFCSPPPRRSTPRGSASPTCAPASRASRSSRSPRATVLATHNTRPNYPPPHTHTHAHAHAHAHTHTCHPSIHRARVTHPATSQLGADVYWLQRSAPFPLLRYPRHVAQVEYMSFVSAY